MTERIHEFLRRRTEDGPCLVVDLEVVRDNYNAFASALPDTRVFYAVKANPSPEVLSLLAGLGSCFDTASVAEIEMALAAGATPDRISYGNTIKKERDIARAFALGVRLFAVDCKAEVEKIARAAPGARVFCRFLFDCAGAEWPLSRKFGCDAGDGRRRARACPPARPRGPRRIVPCRLAAAAHPGLGPGARSRRRRSSAPAPSAASRSPWSISAAASRPSTSRRCRRWRAYGRSIFRALRKHFGNAIPETIIEPGRGMVGNAGIIEAEVVLVSKKSEADKLRWVYLDIGKFGGLAETMDESIRYPIRTPRDGDDAGPCVLAGPTCNSMDVLYEKQPYDLPVSLEIGDKVLIEGTGAYTTTYASVAFNGFAPLKAYHI